MFGMRYGPDIIWAYQASLREPGWVVTRLAMMQEARVGRAIVFWGRASSNASILAAARAQRDEAAENLLAAASLEATEILLQNL